MKHFMKDVFGPDPDEEKRLDREITFKEKVAQLVILMLALISGAYTFEGGYLNNLRVGGATFSTTLSAALLAIGVTAGIITAWWVMMSMIPRMKSPRTIIAGLTLIMMLQGWMLAVSSLNNVIAQTAPSALVMEMSKQLDGLKGDVSLALDRALGVKPFAPILDGQAAARCGQAETERTSGSISGSRGEGAISGTLDSVCEQTQSVSMAVAASIVLTESRAPKVAKLLREMDAVLYDHSKHVFKRETAFMLLASEVEAWLRQTQSDDLTQTLERANEILAAGIITLSSSGGAFGARQAAIIDGLRASIEETGLVFEDIATELRALPDPEFKPLDRVSLVQAVWNNKIAHLPQICAAIGIDFFQLFVVLGFLVARSKKYATR